MLLFQLMNKMRDKQKILYQENKHVHPYLCSNYMRAWINCLSLLRNHDSINLFSTLEVMSWKMSLLFLNHFLCVCVCVCVHKQFLLLQIKKKKGGEGDLDSWSVAVKSPVSTLWLKELKAQLLGTTAQTSNGLNTEGICNKSNKEWKRAHIVSSDIVLAHSSYWTCPKFRKYIVSCLLHTFCRNS